MPLIWLRLQRFKWILVEKLTSSQAKDVGEALKAVVDL